MCEPLIILIILIKLDKEFGYGVIGDKPSHIFPHYMVFGLEVWQLVMLLGLLVREIGLRAIQLRTLPSTVVHIPNALFASGKIENLTQRDKILYRTRLRLSYNDTSE